MGSERHKITGDVIELDYREYSNTDFENCKLIFKGGRPPNLQNVSVTNCEFIFEGAAENTLLMLRFISQGGDANLVVNDMLGLKSWGPKDD